MKRNPTKRTLSDFIRNATEEEKTAVYLVVLADAAEKMRATVERVLTQTESKHDQETKFL